MVSFDAVGTLIYLPRGVGYHYAEVAARHGWEARDVKHLRDSKDAATAELFGAAFGAAWKAMPRPNNCPGPRPDDDRSWWRALVFSVLDRCGIPWALPAREAYFAELYAEFARPGVWALYPEVPALLESLHGRVQLAVMSNFDGRLRTVLEGLDIARYFSHVVISSEVGADKPDPRMFQRLLELSGLSPGQVLHAGDDPDRDWAAATAVGMQAFELRRPHTSLEPLAALGNPPNT